MKKRFFIFSLPRSGSSWLSVFLSGPGAYCYHEPFADGGWIQLYEKWDRRSERVVGAIDTSAHQRNLGLQPDVNYFVLWRDKSAIQSSMRLRGWVMDLDSEISKLTRATVNCIPLYYNYLNEVNYLENIWGSIVGLPFDRERAEYLIEMNVQRKFASVKARDEAHKNAG